jgi:hypothetical protein
MTERFFYGKSFLNQFFCGKGGVLALLDEKNDVMIGCALKQLNKLVDVFWAEIADSITTM